MKEDPRIHKCKNLPKAVEIYFTDGYFKRLESTWQFNIYRESTEEDLQESHLLEEVGETMWSTTIEILHCPYCGKKLSNDLPDKIKDYGKFVLHDHNSYHGKLR